MRLLSVARVGGEGGGGGVNGCEVETGDPWSWWVQVTAMQQHLDPFFLKTKQDGQAI